MADKKDGLDIGSILQGVGSIASLFGDKTTVSSGGTTTRTSSSGLDITQEGINKMLQDILSGTGGLADVSSGQRSSGLYNSTTNQQLTNDLLDRATGTVAAKTAKTTSTETTTTPTTTQTQQAQFGLSDAVLGLGAAMGAKKLYDIIGGTTDAAAATAGASTISSTLSDIIGGTVGSGIDFLGTGSNAVLGSMSSLTGGLGKLFSGDAEGAAVDTAMMLGANAILPGSGPIMAAINSVLPVGDIVSGIGSAIGGIFGSVVCTELFMQGKMNSKLYLTDIAYAKAHMSKRTLDGYRSWGIPLVRLMRKSKVVTDIAGFFAINRAHYVSKLMGKEHSKKRAVAGCIINAVGVPLCYGIGYCIEKYNAVKASTAVSTSLFVRG